jgi:enoyl-CoA hydratase/carnithine racemase
MEYTQIKYEVSDRILTITLDRPEKLNAFTDEFTLPELIDALNRADEDDNIRAIIVTGAGRAFCAGADLSGGNTFDSEVDNIEKHRDGGGMLALRMYEMKKPMIAAINGVAVGVGITMTLPMDIRLASETAKMGFFFAKRGIVVDACSSWILPRIVGVSQAAYWTYTAKLFTAQEALQGRLIQEVLPPDKLMDRAREIAREIADNTSSISVAMIKRLLWTMLGANHPMEAHKIESKLFYWLGKQADSKEGVNSFLEKRPPVFPMKVSRDLPPFYPWAKERPF